MNPSTPMLLPRLRLLAASIGLMTLAACATTPPVQSVHTYRLTWTATRTADHAALFSTSMTVAMGRPATINTHSDHPVENVPAFPRLTARLSPMRASGVLELVTRADLREAIRNKKGKLKITKRNIGALIPIRMGETQAVSLPTDPVHLEVRLERD